MHSETSKTDDKHFRKAKISSNKNGRICTLSFRRCVAAAPVLSSATLDHWSSFARPLHLVTAHLCSIWWRCGSALFAGLGALAPGAGRQVRTVGIISTLHVLSLLGEWMIPRVSPKQDLKVSYFHSLLCMHNAIGSNKLIMNDVQSLILWCFGGSWDSCWSDIVTRSSFCSLLRQSCQECLLHVSVIAFGACFFGFGNKPPAFWISEQAF